MKQTLLYILILTAACEVVSGQKILIERGVKAGELWCFPIEGDTNSYKYLSSELDVSYVNGKPEFSYMRYRFDRQSSRQENTKGGAIMHFLILYNTPEKKVEEATKALQKSKGNNSIKLIGPVIYDKANYHLVTSIAKGDGVESSILASGVAPVLEGNKIPFSFNLDKDKSGLLLNSFQMSTSDISIAFELQFSGLTENYEGKVTVNWNDFYKTEGTSSEIRGNYMGIVGVSAGVKTQVEQLISNKTIEVEVKGSNPTLEEQFNIAYRKIVDLLFEKTEIGSTNEAVSNRGILDMLDVGKNKSIPAAVEASFVYSYRKFTQKGTAVFNFKGKSTASLNQILTFNFRNFYARYGSNKDIFRDVVVDNQFFQTKQIAIVPDISIINEMDSLISNVTVTIRKIHENRDTTIKVVGLNSSSSKTYDQPIYVEYPNKRDNNILRWHEYEYKYTVDVVGGAKFESGWIKTDAFEVRVKCPYYREHVKLSASAEELLAQNVRRVYCEVAYFNYRSNKVLMTVDLSRGQSPYDVTRPIILKSGETKKDYKVTWEFKDKPSVTKTGSTDFDIIPIDL